MPSATRGTTISLTATFKDGGGTPLAPLDPASYPTVTILDIEGLIVTQGVGRALSPGIYSFDLPVSENAKLSTSEKKWLAEWTFVTKAITTHEFSENFDVTDKYLQKVEDREPEALAMEGRSERLFFKRSIEDGTPEEIALMVLREGQIVIHNVVGLAQTEAERLRTNKLRKIIKVEQDTKIIFYFDTDGLSQGRYLVIWETRDNVVAPSVQQVQVLQVPPLIFWLLAPELRSLIDKLQKRLGRVQSYTDADLFMYLRKGLEYVNGVWPPTSFNLNNFTNPAYGLTGWLILASGVWGLTSQQLLEVELSFDFSGQETTINYDHVSGIDTVVSRMLDMLRTEFANSKRQIFIHMQGQGAVGVRPFTTGVKDRVFKIRSGSISEEIGPLLGRIGLI